MSVKFAINSLIMKNDTQHTLTRQSLKFYSENFCETFELLKVPAYLLLRLPEEDCQKWNAKTETKLSNVSSNFSRKGYKENQAEFAKSPEIKIKFQFILNIDFPNSNLMF